ncbi:MAG: polysaccharide biosynthesis protein, partial [Candidatus Acidiferrales bacterium]
DLALNLIRLCGKSEQDVEVQFTGLREGEKIEEELFYQYEIVLPTACAKIKRTNALTTNWTTLCGQLDELRASLSIDGAAPIRAKIKEIVPEYLHQTCHSLDVGTEALANNRFQAVGDHD